MEVDIGPRYRKALIGVSLLAAVSLVSAWLADPSLHFPGPYDGLLFFSYVLLMFGAWVFPVRLGEQSITIVLGIEIPLFLQFGAVFTVLIVSGAWVLSQWATGREIRTHRFFTNVSMFTLMTTLSALAYQTTGGSSPPIVWGAPLWHLMTPLIAFLSIHFILNYSLTLIYELSKDNRRIEDWVTGVLWGLVALVIEVLVAGLFVVLQHMYGHTAFLVAMFPFAGLIYIFKLYSNLIIANKQLSSISAITMRLSTKLQEEELLKVLLDGMPHLVLAARYYVFTLNEQGLLAPSAVLGASEEVEKQMRQIRIDSGEGVTGLAYARGIAILQRMDTQSDIIGKLTALHLKIGASVMAVPLHYNEQTLGVLTLVHADRHAFSRRDREMVQILANQAAIGLWNARRYAETQELSLIDPLTKIYNYRYFEMILDKMCQKSEMQKAPVTLLVLDLDHFKRINDSYGHLAGNEVLRSFAQTIKEQVRDGDIVCRYGGEEFTVILPGASMDVGLQIAERLRNTVEATPILVPPMGNKSILPIRITVSVGAATFPDMADSAHNLLRNADRAMYVGSKQKGRNRVAVYEQING